METATEVNAPAGANGHANEIPPELLPQEIKCTWCGAVNPKFITRFMEMGERIGAFVFACLKCKRILSISAVIAPNDPPSSPQDEGLIVKPF